MSLSKTVQVIVVGALLGGCGHARLVHSRPDSGAIAVEGTYMDAVSRARMLAIEHCAGRVVIDEPAAGSDLLTFRCEAAAPVVVAVDHGGMHAMVESP